MLEKIFVNNTDFLIKSVSVALFSYWWIYWIINARKAEKEKPKTVSPSWKSRLREVVSRIFSALFLFQLFGIINILVFSYNLTFQAIGLFLVIMGISIGIFARKTLSSNWTHAAEYQIKKNHQLITEGVYQYIRHPIYTGLILAYTGAEIIFHTYLFIPIFFLILFLAYIQAKQEEKLLLNHFGDKYKSYMKRTKMFFPFVF